MTSVELEAALNETMGLWETLSHEFYKRTDADIGQIGEGSVNPRDWLEVLTDAEDDAKVRKNAAKKLTAREREVLGLD